MFSQIGFDYRKSVQAINFLARRYPEFRLNKMKALKLIWAADRFHIRKYGRPVLGDSYVAMPYGPVPSATRDLIEKNSYLEEWMAYAERFLKSDRYELISTGEFDGNLFSETDIEALEFAFLKYGDKDQWQLRDITHFYPEWKKFEKVLTSGQTSVESMDYKDFFKNPEVQPDANFDVDGSLLSESMEVYSENLKLQTELSK